MFKPPGAGRLVIALVVTSALLLSLLPANNPQYAIAQGQDTPYGNVPTSPSESFRLPSDLLYRITLQLRSIAGETKPVGGVFRSGFEPFKLDPIEQFGVACEALVVMFWDPVTHQLLPVKVDCDQAHATIRSLGPGLYLFLDRATAPFPVHFTSPRRILPNAHL